MTKSKFSIQSRISSFRFAFNGLRILTTEEHNSRIHIFMAIQTIIIGSIVHLSATEWMAIVFAIGFVISTEILNTAIENIADFVSPGRNQHIKKIKDLAAASVLVSTLTSITIGFIIFIPKLIELCSN
jgi:undecaprenol kinase/diacylglycerol kinase (ATP)